MHKYQWPFSELFNDAQWTSELTLALQKRYTSIGCQVCKKLYRIISESGQLRKSSRTSGLQDSYPKPDVFLSRKNVPRKPEIFYTTFGSSPLTYPSVRWAIRPSPGFVQTCNTIFDHLNWSFTLHVSRHYVIWAQLAVLTNNYKQYTISLNVKYRSTKLHGNIKINKCLPPCICSLC
jgi:hypothetical protein